MFFDKYDFIEAEPLSLKIIEKHPGDNIVIPFYYWDILLNGHPIGKISLRIGSNFHSYYNGNVGYEINEPHRGKNYAYKACLLILPVAVEHGMNELILSCEESNIASYKTIEKLSAELIEIVDVPRAYFAWQEDMEKQRIYRLRIEH